MILQSCWYVFMSWVSTILLYCIGWKTTIHIPSLQMIESHPNDLVLLFQHTSYTDLLYALLFTTASGISGRCYFIMGNFIGEKYWYLKPIFRYIGCIYVPYTDCSNPQGTVDRVANILTNDPTERKIILISPTGSTKSDFTTKWRSGWYYLAKSLSADIGVIGVNFHPLIRTIHLGQPEICNGSFLNPEEHTLEDCTDLCKISMQSVFPRWPQHSPVPLKTPKKILSSLVDVSVPHFTYFTTPLHTVQFIDWIVLSSCVFWISVIASYYANMYDLTLLGALTTIASIQYHRNYEYHQVWHDRDVLCSYASFYVFVGRCVITLPAQTWLIWGLALVCCFQIYLIACPRKGNSPFRSIKYQQFHPLFHIVLNLVVYSYCSILA
jgi:hypothetical protein